MPAQVLGERGGVPVTVGTTFTQNDINLGHLRYQHNGSETVADSFAFTAADKNGGGDVRNTLITLAFDGPQLFGDWKAGATVEMDFFGGFGGSTNSSFIDQQPVPRLRLG